MKAITQIRSRRVKITPAMAAKMIADHNHRNRPPSKNTVKRYADLMRRGEFKLNGDTICIDNTGEILDGQQRLLACIEADVPFETFMIEGLEPGVFDTKDTGKPRSAADALSVAGLNGSSRLVASIANLAIKMESGTLRRNRYVEPHTVRSWVEENPDVLEAAERVKKLSFLGFAPVLGLAYFLAKQSEPEKAKLFFDELESGENLTKTDPAYTLRETLMRHKSDRSYHKADVLAMAAKAWDSFTNDKPLSKLHKPKAGNLAFS